MLHSTEIYFYGLANLSSLTGDIFLSELSEDKLRLGRVVADMDLDVNIDSSGLVSYNINHSLGLGKVLQ